MACVLVATIALTCSETATPNDIAVFFGDTAVRFVVLRSCRVRFLVFSGHFFFENRHLERSRVFGASRQRFVKVVCAYFYLGMLHLSRYLGVLCREHGISSSHGDSVEIVLPLSGLRTDEGNEIEVACFVDVACTFLPVSLTVLLVVCFFDGSVTYCHCLQVSMQGTRSVRRRVDGGEERRSGVRHLHLRRLRHPLCGQGRLGCQESVARYDALSLVSTLLLAQFVTFV